MATFSKFLSLITGSDRTADLSLASNVLAVANHQLLGSTSGFIQMQAAGTTTSYTIIWPSAQSSGTRVLQNDGSGNLSWSDLTTQYANVTLSNLGTTSINAALLPSSSIAIDLGSQTLKWRNVFTDRIKTSLSLTAIDITNRTLYASDNAQMLNWGTDGQINVNSNRITNVQDPSGAQDAATKNYVDSKINGLTWQGPAQAYAASNVPLTGGASLTIDSYSVQNGDLVILGNQTTASQNGEYLVSGIGTAYTLTANGLPTVVGDAWLITKGTLYGNSAFVATAVVPAATFIEFAGPQALSYTAPLSISGNTVSIALANASNNGYLSSTDWTTFNNKQPAGNYITALTGDATASGPGSAALTLATVNSNVGTFTNATVTVNAKGLVTAASSGTSGTTTSEAAGEAFAATTLFAVRWAKAADAGFVAGRVYKADNDTTSADNFYAIGLVYPPGSVSAAGAITVTEFGIINVPSHGFTVGAPLFLGAAGVVTTTAPSATLSAVVRVGMVKDANNIFVNIQTVGVN